MTISYPIVCEIDFDWDVLEGNVSHAEEMKSRSFTVDVQHSLLVLGQTRFFREQKWRLESGNCRLEEHFLCFWSFRAFNCANSLALLTGLPKPQFREHICQVQWSVSRVLWREEAVRKDEGGREYTMAYKVAQPMILAVMQGSRIAVHKRGCVPCGNRLRDKIESSFRLSFAMKAGSAIIIYAR